MYADFEKVTELKQLNAILQDVWQSAPITVSSPEDITDNVFAGLKDSQEERRRKLAKYGPAWVKPWAPHILGLTDSFPYR